AFRYRLVLAATLSPAYGIYSGYELCENEPQSARSEEYRDSEKYQFRPRDWSRSGSLAPLVTQLNQIRREHPALQQLRRVHFHRTDDPLVLAYSKHNADRSDVVLAAVNLDPRLAHRAELQLSLPALGFTTPHPLQVTNLLTGESTTWRGPRQTVELDPKVGPALLVSVRR
ncbi:MAG TPA: alpha-1,4-glucan--maltose-1-phosphate maltosyltransferase, partial [Candidatus Dormibacteraeota bacterium]